MASVAQGDDVAVVALHVAAVEELVEVGGELVCVAGGVGGGSRGCESVFDVVPRVHDFSARIPRPLWVGRNRLSFLSMICYYGNGY